jgi:hypothetical protein
MSHHHWHGGTRGAAGNIDLAHETSFSRLLAAIGAVLDARLGDELKVRFGRQQDAQINSRTAGTDGNRTTDLCRV